MKDVFGVLLIVLMLLISVATCVLAEHKDEIFERIVFKKGSDKNAKNN